MQIIILFIPPHATVEELRQFVRRGLGNPLAFWLKRSIGDCDILDIQDNSLGTRESHGLVSIADADMAERLIQNLNGRPFKGKPVEVRSYNNRTPGDRRIGQVAGGNEVFRNSRRKELDIKRRSQGHKITRRPGFLKLNDTRADLPFSKSTDSKD